MKKNTFYIIATITFSTFSFAQVGINTETPQKTLHVNGSIQITNELNVGGNKDTAGSAGETGNFLQSNGPGAAPSWVGLEDQFIPTLSAIGLRTTVTGTFAQFATTTLVFNSVPKINPLHLTYNSTTGVFTVQKAGYYQILVYLMYDNNSNPSGQTNGTAITTIMRNENTSIVGGFTSAHGERTPTIYHSPATTAYFNIGDRLSVRGSFTQIYKFGAGSNISVTYMGE
ncbi:hypothetical protein [Epilithonimonas hungarica]|uniref:C1q domain-containing protein n=1 Tax=Epilithonimonas hungarica TaxID=454006 RepID=A0A1G7JLP1_9FLAO|nr:hypothetical protein [Epilithonimonas hungarica]SDF25813.1 hypothetical protein SAMN05421825_1422 [Epilithonimonas hungarica]